MYRLDRRLATLAATLVIGVTAARAQNTVTLNASVPFPFTAGTEKVLPAGNYQIPASADSVWRILNRSEGTSHFVPGNGVRNSSRPTDTPKLVFECRQKGCALRQIQTGGGEIGYTVPAPKRSKSDAEEARVVFVPMTLASD
jgi:hypothetical protein